MCDTLDRLRRSSDRLAQLHAETLAERERRDGLILAARDDGCGHSWHAIAAAAQRSPPRCHEIATKQLAAV